MASCYNNHDCINQAKALLKYISCFVYDNTGMKTKRFQIIKLFKDCDYEFYFKEGKRRKNFTLFTGSNKNYVIAIKEVNPTSHRWISLPNGIAYSILKS